MKASVYPLSAGLSPAAHALRPMRIDRAGDAVHYEAVSYVGESRKGCELQIRRMECFGMLTKREGQLQGSWFLDVLDAGGEILDTLEVSSSGVKYMRRTLRMRRERPALLDASDQSAARS